MYIVYTDHGIYFRKVRSYKLNNALMNSLKLIGLWADWMEQHESYIRFLPRLARTKLKVKSS